MMKKKAIVLSVLASLYGASVQAAPLTLEASSVQIMEKMNELTELAKDPSNITVINDQKYLNYKGKPQQERVDYMMATSYYNEEDYILSAYYYEKFVSSYPRSTKREESMFLLAKSHSLNSLKYNLDQDDTVKSINSFQEFINKYPESDKLKESNEIVAGLQDKIEKKALEIGKL